MEHNKILDFFANKSIFITGCTGAVGTALVEKLLRSFPNIKKLILLIRRGRGKTSTGRKSIYFEDPFFAVTKRTHKDFLTKIIWMDGDIEEPNLGLGKENIDYIWNNVNIVYHCAASIHLTQKLKPITKTNLCGTEILYNVMRQCKHLQCFMYVSTLYSNHRYSQTELKEEIYDCVIDPNKLIEMCNSGSTKAFELKCSELIKDWPNCYSFSKNAAENLMAQKKDNVKIGVFRVSCVTESYREPIPGWLINENVFTIIMRKLHTGLTFKFNPKITIPICPIDLSTNALIAATFDTANMCHNLKVYNMTGEVPKFMDIYKMYLSNFQNPSLIFGGLKYRFLSHMKDLVLEISGQQGIYVKEIEKWQHMIAFSQCFIMKDISISCDNLRELWQSMNDAERSILFFNLKDVDYPQYIKNMYELNKNKFIDVMDIKPTMVQLSKL